MIGLATTNPAVHEHWTAALAGTAPLRSCATPADVAALGVGGVLLIDAGAPPDALQPLPKLVQSHPGVHCVAAYGVYDAPAGLALLGAGFRGYCNRRAAPPVLRQVIDTVEQGNAWVGKDLLEQMIRLLQPPAATAAPALPDPLMALTPRESETLALLIDGLHNDEIARRLGITARTVKAHVSAILRKYGVEDRLHLALLLRSGHA